MTDTWPRSALQIIEAAFVALAQQREPVTLDGLNLSTLRSELLRPSTPIRVKDAVWRRIVTHAREDGEPWTVVAAGMAMPGLRHHAGQLAAGYRGDVEDLDAELVSGFFVALADADVSRRAIAARLIWAARRAAVRLRYADVEVSAGDQIGLLPGRSTEGHPYLVLLEAVAAGTLNLDEARLISATRLDDVRVERVAVDAGQPPNTVRVRRRRAERRLVAALTAGAF